MANPVLNEDFVTQERVLTGEPMTIAGTINKTLIMLVLIIASSAYTWSLLAQGFVDKAQGLMIGGAIAGFILALVAIFSTAGALRKGEEPKAVAYITPIYAVCEGLFLGGISAFFEAAYTGIVIQAVIATFAALFSMLFLFKIGAIRATEKFRSIIFVATLSVAVIYLIQIIASFFGRGIPVIFEAGTLGIVFSLVVIAIASLNFIIDFDFIERASTNLMPKNYEWYGALGLMITLVWLYLEMLRLLAKLNSRR